MQRLIPRLGTSFKTKQSLFFLRKKYKKLRIIIHKLLVALVAIGTVIFKSIIILLNK